MAAVDHLSQDQISEVIHDFHIDYASDKDNMSVVSGTAHVRVSDSNALHARLTAEQMVGATGREPVAVRVNPTMVAREQP